MLLVLFFCDFFGFFFQNPQFFFSRKTFAPLAKLYIKTSHEERC